MHTKPVEAVFRPAMILMAGRALGFIAAFAIPMVLARMFDQNVFGTYKQLFLIYGTLFGIAQAGMAESLYYFLPNEAQRGGGYVFNTLMVLTALGGVSLVALWLMQETLARLLNNPELVGYIPIIGAALLFMLMSVVLEIVMTVKKEHLTASCAYAATDLLRAVFLIVPVLLFSDLRWLLIGAVAFAVIRLGVTFIYLKMEYGRSLRLDMPLLRKHLGYAIPFGLAGLIEVVQVNFHLYAVSWYFDVATFAIYAVGCLQVPLIDFLMTSTSNVMMINMREKMLDGNQSAMVSIWLDTIRKLALIFFPLVTGLLLLSHELIVLLFTSSYERSVPIFMVWTGTMLFATLLTDGVLRVFAETRFLILQNFIRLMIIATLIHWFLERLGVIGAVLVTLVATFVTKLLALGRVKSILQVSLAELLPWKALAAAAAIAAASAVPPLLLKLAFSISAMTLPDLLLLIVSGALYTGTYYCLLLWLGPLHDDEKQMLMQSVHKRISLLLRGRKILES